jgi:hypothetical protein
MLTGDWAYPWDIRVNRKPTHTNLYLNAMSHNRLVNKQAVLSTLVHRAKAICDPDRLQQKLEFLQDAFLSNGYSKQQILWDTNLPKRVTPPRREDPTLVACLPFVCTTFNCISRVLSRHNIKTMGLPPRKLSIFLHPVKNDLSLEMPVSTAFPVSVGRCTLDKLETRVKEHHWHVCLYHPEMSAVAEHSINLGHCIQLQNTSILARKVQTY